MREILFRGKVINRNPNCKYRANYQNGDWVYGLVSKMFDSYFKLPTEMTNENGVSGIEVDGETVTQYTGLTDMNGTKIFEGDIVKVDDDFETFGKMAGEIREVWFKDGGFRLKPKYPSAIARGDRGYWMEDGSDFEVIGNVWDNPELIRSGST